MVPGDDAFDAVVIGGGFYGSMIALYLARHHRQRVLLLEAEPRILGRASFANQARVHNGYHYPRSLRTAYRSRVNLPKFLADWPTAVQRDLTKVYAIAKGNTKTSASQFERFCREIGARFERAPKSLQARFSPQLIEDVFLVEEYAFDAVELGRQLLAELLASGVTLRLECRATAVHRSIPGGILIELEDARLPRVQEVRSRRVFNCTYSGLNQLKGDFHGTTARLKHEMTELALIEAPRELRDLAITVIDGPFFSIMPFPARDLHTLSHVRYTPHFSWEDAPDQDPAQHLALYDRRSRVNRMLLDASRYFPDAARYRHVDSLFETKTILLQSEPNDGRPILFEKDDKLPGLYSVLGGKIDNVYDILEILDREIAQA